MAKTQRKHRNSEGKLKKVYRPSSTQKEKKHESQFQKFSAYSNRKAEEQQSKDMMTRQAALDAMGMPVEQQEFGFEDHKALYNYAQERASFNQPPIKIIDPSAVLKVELSQSKKETVLKQETVLNATGSRDSDVARLGRAKKIFHSSQLNCT